MPTSRIIRITPLVYHGGTFSLQGAAGSGAQDERHMYLGDEERRDTNRQETSDEGTVHCVGPSRT